MQRHHGLECNNRFQRGLETRHIPTRYAQNRWFDKKGQEATDPKAIGKQTTSGSLSFPIGARTLGKRSTRTISGLAVSKNREAVPSSFEDPTQSVGGPTPNRASPHADGNLVESFDLDVSEVNFATRIMCL